jgi:hypothetical protein
LIHSVHDDTASVTLRREDVEAPQNAVNGAAARAVRDASPSRAAQHDVSRDSASRPGSRVHSIHSVHGDTASATLRSEDVEAPQNAANGAAARAVRDASPSRAAQHDVSRDSASRPGSRVHSIHSVHDDTASVTLRREDVEAPQPAQFEMLRRLARLSMTWAAIPRAAPVY